MRAFTEPAVIAAGIAAIGALLGALFSARVQRSLKRDDAASQSLSAQLTGWSSLNQVARAMVEDLRKELRETEQECEARIAAVKAACDIQIAAVQEEMRRREIACDGKIAALESRLRLLGARIDDMGGSQ